MSLKEMQEASLDFFFDMFKFCFDFLSKVTVLGIPVLYIFLGILIVSVVMLGLLNVSSVSIGSGIKSQRRSKRSNNSENKGK